MAGTHRNPTDFLSSRTSPTSSSNNICLKLTFGVVAVATMMHSNHLFFVVVVVATMMHRLPQPDAQSQGSEQPPL